MLSSPLSPDLFVDSDRSSSRRNKNDEEMKNQAEIPAIQWKSESQHQIYSSKLFHALQQLRSISGGASGSRSPPPPNRVRDTAYRVLATTAKGRSRWSRAILSTPLKMKFMKKKNSIAKRHRKLMTVIATGNNRLPKKSVSRLKSKGLPAFQRKARILSKLIPGCRKQPVLVVLEEVIDYIPALEMQVRVMSDLAQRLSPSTPGFP